MGFFDHAFYWSLLSSINLVRKVIIFFTPTKVLEKFIRKDFAKMGIKYSLEYPGANQNDDDILPGECDVEITVHNREYFRSMAAEDELGMGESYVDGWWDLDYEHFPKLVHCLMLKDSKFKPFMKLRAKVMDKGSSQAMGKKSREVVELHYNLGSDLYENFLDKYMQYSCGYWKPDTKTLEEAQINKLDLIARKLKLKPGMTVLDLGSGFGGLAKYLAENYKVSVVGYNISEEMVAYAKKLCEGLPCEFRLDDYRNATGKYDRVLSVGFFEHVGQENFREYFEVAERCLKDDGLLLTHTITCRDRDVPRTTPWIYKYIFPGGLLPYPDELFTSAEGLFMVEDTHNIGYSYAKTLNAWRVNFNRNWPELKPKYGELFHGKFFRLWNFYLASCTGFFTVRVTNLYQVVYSKKGVKGGYESVR